MSAVELGSEDNTIPRKSFLDIRSLGGRSIKEKSPPQVDQTPAKRRKVSFLLKPRKRAEAQPTDKPKVTAKGLTAGVTSHPEGTVPNATNERESPNAAMEKGLLCIEKTDHQDLLKRGSESPEAWDVNLASGQAVQAARQTAGQTHANLGSRVKQTPTLSPIIESRRELRRSNFLQAKIQREVDNLKLNIAKLDTNRRNLSNSAATDQSWIEDVMRDITKKGDEVKEQPVSIHTTTTTGCDLQTLRSSPSQVLPAAKKAIHKTCEKSQEHLTPITNSLAGEVSPQSRTSSTLLRQETGAIRIQADTTSETNTVSTTHPESTSVLTNTHRHVRREKVKFSKSPISTSTTPYPIVPVERNLPKQTSHCNKAESAQQHNRPPRILLLVEDHSQETTTVSTPDQVEVNQPLPQSLAEMEQASLWENDDTLGGMGRYPGTYPRSQDEEDDTGVPFADKTTSIVTMPSLGQCLWALLNALKAVGNAIKSLVQLYFSFVGPVLDSSSDYWRRAANDQSTLEDCAAAFLALPFCFLAVMAMAWGLQLLVWAWINLEEFVHSSIDEYY